MISSAIFLKPFSCMNLSADGHKRTAFGIVSHVKDKGDAIEQVKPDKYIQNSHALNLQAGQNAVGQNVIHLASQTLIHFRIKSRAVVPDRYLPGAGIFL